MKEQLSDTQRREIEAAEEKAASAWFTVLPIKWLGYALNKRDAIAMRYGWTVKDIPDFCACWKENSIDHTLICKKKVATYHYVTFLFVQYYDISFSPFGSGP